MEARIKRVAQDKFRICRRETVCFLKLTAIAVLEKMQLLHDFVAKFLNHRVSQDFLGHSLDLLFGRITCHAIQFEHKKLTLADVPNLAKPKRRQGMLDGLALRIEDRSLRHDPHMCFHRGHYSKPNSATPE